uniref:Regulatory protein HrpB n=1 Tax=Ralstonia solanacearum TaxID=305 RepID=U3UA36_RALSL|nr:regulatory protein HrpB [Ralstonia solanacearum]
MLDFAVAQASAARERLTEYANAVFAADFDRAYQLVDHHSTQRGKSDDYSGVLAIADASLLLECDEKAEEGFRLAQRLIRHSDDQLRVVSCRNTGWQALLRDRYAAAASCFARIAEDDGATWTQQVEGLIGLALVHHQLGQQDAADKTLQAGREAPNGSSDRGWLGTIDLIIYEFAVQAGIRCSNRLIEHAFWQSAEIGATLLANHGGRNGWSPTASQEAAIPALIQRRAEYLGLLRRIADGERAAIDPLLAILNHDLLHHI